ncbi:MAG: integrase [Deltaproteobacteria bacterium]|nr:MAG: integrase [Deltaproteobacteria bacterium]
MKPDTAVRWHREGFRRYWRWISVPGPGRPRISEEKRDLIVRMAVENGWRARRIQGELSKLGISVSLATISRYLPRPDPEPGHHHRWVTFLRNHKDWISGMDFFVVPTVRFKLLYVWFAIDHGRRRVLSFNVTASPTALWVSRRLRDAFSRRAAPSLSDPRQRDRESRSASQAHLISESLAERTAERFVGTVRRELLDHVVVLHEAQLRRLLREYIEYYNEERVHSAITDAPPGRAFEPKPSGSARITRSSRVGGLHGRYAWREAA